MGKYKVEKSGWHKGWVWLFSRVENNVFSSVHQTGDNEDKGRTHYAQRFQKEHDEQIEGFIAQSAREDAEWLVKNGGVTKHR